GDRNSLSRRVPAGAGNSKWAISSWPASASGLDLNWFLTVQTLLCTRQNSGTSFVIPPCWVIRGFSRFGTRRGSQNCLTRPRRSIRRRRKSLPDSRALGYWGLGLAQTASDRRSPIYSGIPQAAVAPGSILLVAKR